MRSHLCRRRLLLPLAALSLMVTLNSPGRAHAQGADEPEAVPQEQTLLPLFRAAITEEWQTFYLIGLGDFFQKQQELGYIVDFSVDAFRTRRIRNADVCRWSLRLAHPYEFPLNMSAFSVDPLRRNYQQLELIRASESEMVFSVPETDGSRHLFAMIYVVSNGHRILRPLYHLVDSRLQCP